MEKKSCSDPLIEKGINVTAAANTTTQVSFTVPTARGDIMGMQVFVGDNTLADLINDTLNIDVSGVNYYENVPIIKFASPFSSSNNEFPLQAGSGSVIGIKVVNVNATPFVVHVNFLFRRPR